jgi:hypothetical protein
MMQNKPIGFILINRVDTRWYKLPINTFELYTTGELLNYPEYWMPVYSKPEPDNFDPIGYIYKLQRGTIMNDFVGVKPENWTPVYKHEKPNPQFRYYAIMVMGRSAPTKLHDSLEDAEKEAIRLAEKEKCKVYVLKAISEICITQEVKKINLL